jgi:hypothetical protein
MFSIFLLIYVNHFPESLCFDDLRTWLYAKIMVDLSEQWRKNTQISQPEAVFETVTSALVLAVLGKKVADHGGRVV